MHNSFYAILPLHMAMVYHLPRTAAAAMDPSGQLTRVMAPVIVAKEGREEPERS